MPLKPNKIKYSTTDDGISIRVDNFSIGTTDSIAYAPTSSTNYWMGITPPISGYTIYRNKSAQGPSIYTPQNDSDLVSFTKNLWNASVTNATEAIAHIDSQVDSFVLNKDYPNVVLSGLSYLYDAGFTGSYPRSGTTWKDLSFSGKNATTVGTTTFVLSGDGYFNFTKTPATYCSTAGIANIFSSWTIDAWVLFKSIPASSDTTYYPSVITTNYSNVGDVNFGLFFGGFINATTGGDNSKLVCGFFQNNVVGDIGGWFSTSGFTPTLNTWYNISGTYNRNSLKLYRNGSIFATRSNTTPLTQNNGTLYLMRRWDSDDTIDGYLMVAKVYSRALSDSEVLQNYNAHASPLDIITSNLLVQLDAGNILSYPRLGGTTWQSMVYSTTNNATLTNGPTFDSSNVGSINFDGTNDYASIPSNFFNPDSGGSFSINIWFKTSTSGGTIFGQKSSSDPSTATSSVPAIYIDTNGKLVTSCFSGASVNEIQTSSTSVADGNWHNVVVTFASNTQKTYIDNVLLGSLSKTQVSYSATYYYFVGAGYSTGWPNSDGAYFNGRIGYMSFYNSELSSNQVTQNYNALKNRYL